VNAIANKNWKPGAEVDTRYHRARQEWDRRMGTALAQAYNWRLAALLALGLVFVALLGTIYLGAQPKAVPPWDRPASPRGSGSRRMRS
jgi:type IV secretion system protein VirB5